MSNILRLQEEKKRARKAWETEADRFRRAKRRHRWSASAQSMSTLSGYLGRLARRVLQACNRYNEACQALEIGARQSRHMVWRARMKRPRIVMVDTLTGSKKEKTL